MKHILSAIALLVMIIAGMLFVMQNGGDADRDVPGKTTDAGKNKLAD